jgi:hypothetical protein
MPNVTSTSSGYCRECTVVSIIVWRTAGDEKGPVKKAQCKTQTSAALGLTHPLNEMTLSVIPGGLQTTFEQSMPVLVILCLCRMPASSRRGVVLDARRPCTVARRLESARAALGLSRPPVRNRSPGSCCTRASRPPPILFARCS